eukprot:scaffold15433_cov29-Prasinocladus_malaysianus.AAC.1
MAGINTLSMALLVSSQVQLLRAGPDAEVTLCAVDAMRHVVATPANAKALLKAGGVSPLLKLLEAGPEHEVTHQVTH